MPWHVRNTKQTACRQIETNKMNVAKRNIGVNVKGDAVEISVWAPLKEDVQLQVGEAIISLEKDEAGYWRTTTNDLQPGDHYKFLVEGKAWPDPASLSQPDGVHEASEVVDLSFEWTDGDWNNLPLHEYILYELHTGTFSEEGNFAGIEEKLDYLKELGVNAIEIMPIAQFPGGRNWGYDGVFPFAVQNSYGGPKALQRLVNACHEKGIAVVLDVVYNHLGPEGNYLGVYGPYFTEKYKTPWGGALSFDDAWCDGVRRFFVENALMWFRDFHVDALRLDAVHAIKDFSPSHILRDIRLAVDELMQQTGGKHHLIAELDLNDTKFINKVAQCGYGMDAQWIDEFHHALRVTATGETTGYYSDFSGIEHLAKAYRDAYVYDGQWSPHRKKSFGVKTENEGQQFIVFAQNHDQVGNRMLGERLTTLVSFEMQKLIAAAVLVSPYLPMLFMGEEWSEPNPFLYFVSHTDEDLAEAVRKGRKAEFAAFHLEGEAPDPVAEGTFMQSKLQWQLMKEGQHAVMLKYYKALIQLRKTHPVLKALNRKNLEVQSDVATNTLLLRRWEGEQQLLCGMNFSKEAQRIAMPEGEWKVIFYSADEQWGGSATQAPVIENGSITVPAECLVILERTF
jgi:maltooligosyltrehalose trehalohydrolase